MALQFFPLVAPAANGSGAAVDVSALGAEKTIVVQGNGDDLFQIYEQIEVSNDPAALIWWPICRFLIPGTQNVTVACKWMRATTQNYKRGTAPIINVGGEATGCSFTEVVATAGNGTGTAVDVSALGQYKTIQVSGTFKGTVNIEASNDGGTTWAQAQGFSFKNKGGIYSAILFCDQIRVTRSGVSPVSPGLPIINVGAANVGAGIPTPEFPATVQITTIYATATGSDIIGNGSQTNPYETYQFAILRVPLVINANERYIVDVTDLGIETLESNYTMPPIHGAGQLDQSVTFAVNPWYRFRGAVSTYATPAVFTGVPLADTDIALADVLSLTADAETGLYTLTLNVARASWNANACRGAIFRATSPTSVVGQGDAIVTSSTTTTLTLTVGSNPGGTAIVPVGPFSLKEQSATLLGQFNINNVDSFAFGGIKFQHPTPSNGAIIMRSSLAAFAFQYCDFGRITIQGMAGYLPTFETCYFHGGTSQQFQGTNLLVRKCYFNGVTAWDTLPDVGYIYAQGCVWEACAPVGKTVALGSINVVTGGFAPQNSGGLGLWLVWCLVTAATTHGVESSGGGQLIRCQINGSTGDGVRVDRARGPLGLLRVTGSANTGYGLQVLNGSTVNVSSLTTITGTLGDMKVGGNVTRTWADFRANPPLLNENDLAAGVLSTMCRVYES